jgi:flagellar M-ring protein FliF
MLVTLIIALALVLFVMRPLLRRVLTPEQAPLALSQSSEITAMQPQSAPAVADGAPFEDDNGAPRQPRVPQWMNTARHAGESQAATLKTVGSIVEENPKQAATIVRDWLSSAA